jgi:serine/threonine-protein kinase
MRLLPHAAFGVAVALVVTFAIARDASAQATDKATAEVLFNQGKALLAEGKLAEACPKLAESLRLDTGIGTMLYLAECYERSGMTASAWAQFREAQATAAKESDAREKIARERADQLEPKLSRFSVTVPSVADVPGLVVTRDGTEIGRAGWGVESPIDPGRHVIRASAPGRLPRETTIDVAPRSPPTRFVVAALELAPAAPGPVPGPRETPAPTPEGSSKQRTIGIGLAAAGVVAAGVGTFFGLRAISSLDDADPHCNRVTCDQRGLDLRDRSQSQANVSTVLFIVAGVAVAGGAVLFFTSPRRPSSTASASWRNGALRF